MSRCCCIVGLILSILLSRIQVGQCCISVEFMNENNVLKLSCVIPSFSGTGSWYVDSLSLTSCSPTLGCTVMSSGNYTFSSDSLGIYVNIDPFSSLEVGKLWKCDNAPSFECNVTVSEPQDSSGDSDGKLGTGAIIGIFIGSLAGAVGIFFLIVCIWMCVVGRKRNKKTDVVGDEEAMDVCCCATCSCCVCCSTFLMSVTCNLFVNRKKPKIAPKDVEEFIYVKKNSNMEFGEHQSNARNAKWVKDGNEIATTHIKCTMFKIDKASVNHEGLYICISNDLKRKYYLIVVGRTEMVYVEEDQDVELGVKIPGIEHISGVKWKNDRHDVKQDNVVENKLQILNASLHDEGKYFCTFGTKNKLTYLLIIVGTEKTINVIEGNQIEFGKEIPDSDATSDAYWTKDGSRIESTSPKKTFYQIDQADGNSKGLYVCHLGNKAELKYRLIKSE